MASRIFKIEILGSASGAKKAFKEAGLAGSSFGKGIGKIGKSMAIGLGGAAAGAAVIGKKSLDAAIEAQKVQRSVAAAIKSTGGSAGVTAKQIENFAGKMQFKTGIDDEAIKTSQTMLLGFRRVKNETGQGNKIFDRASVAMLDLGKKMGSTDNAAKALGKALSDPVGGLKGLKGAGVLLSAQQKEQIKGFVASGDLLSAQKIVLDEVTKATGGYAASTTTAGDRAKLAFGEIQEKIGGVLLPVAEKLSTWFVDKLIPAVQSFFKKHGPQIKHMFQQIADKIKPVAHWLGENIPKALKKVGQFVKDNTGVVKVFAGTLGVLAVALGLVAAVMYILSINPIVLIIIGIMVAVAALVAGLYYLYDRFKFIRDAVDLLGTVFKAVFGAIFFAVKLYFGLVKLQFDILVAAFGWLWDHTKGMREGMVDIFKSVFEGIRDALRMGWNGLVSMVNPIIKKLHNLPGLSWLPADGLPMWPGDQGSQREKTVNTGGVRRFATGGIVTKPMMGIVGEAGPEAVIPLSKFGGMGGSTTVNITVNASPLSSPADVGSAVVDALKAYERRNGSLPLKVA